MNDFIIYTDCTGNMPQLTKIGVPLAPSLEKSHKHWTEYRDNKPVLIRPLPNQSRVWDYSKNEFVSIEGVKVVK